MQEVLNNGYKFKTDTTLKVGPSFIYYMHYSNKRNISTEISLVSILLKCEFCSFSFLDCTGNQYSCKFLNQELRTEVLKEC